jgi:hypothetical protein
MFLQSFHSECIVSHSTSSEHFLGQIEHPLRRGGVAVREFGRGPINEPIKGQALTAEAVRHTKNVRKS